MLSAETPPGASSLLPDPFKNMFFYPHSSDQDRLILGGGHDSVEEGRVPSKLRNKSEHDEKPVAVAKQLCLVLDLDHTLLHSVGLEDITPEEEYLLTQSEDYEVSKDCGIFKVESMGTITKLRPFVRSFLEEASKMFKMYIYTKGCKPYALEMAKLLDPHGKYFEGRVISRDDPGAGTDQKRLEVAKVRKTAALIVDDRQRVWRRHKANLIKIERYHYFVGSCRSFKVKRESYSVMRLDEDEDGGALQVVLGVLRQVHRSYVADRAGEGDVRHVLDALRKDVLRGCSLAFDSLQKSMHVWDLAERFGAECSLGPNPSTTHVVSRDFGSKKSRWGWENEKIVVSPGWISAACYNWKKPHEEEYSLALKELQPDHDLFQD